MEDTRQLSDIGILYPLDTFTVNLKSDAGRRYLKCTLSLELEGEELSLELDAKSAVLRDRIIRILTSKTLEEISSKKGKQKVSNQIMDTLNAMISDGEIKGIYFTEFVIQ
jgi:flagellar FliL protein